MAASTWFQGSAWPPGNHGIIPSPSCTAARDATVAATSASSRSPASSVLPTTTLVGAHAGADLELDGVDDQALAQHRVERPLGGPHPGTGADDVPDEEPVVEADGQGGGAGN